MGEVNRVLRATAANQSSMLADVMRNVPTEVDVLNGTIVQMAKKVGTSAPLNRSIVSRLSRLQQQYGQKREFSTVRVISSVQDMQKVRDQFGSSSVGFVPTMGGLHRGHLDLVRAAAESCDKIVVSIYVNPTQFGPHEDFTKYPRTLPQDLEQLQTLGLDSSRLVVFAPGNLYVPNHFLYVIPEGGLNATGEGVSRPGHFKGVATVVLKLFNIVRPTKAFFGQKDGQQCIVVKALVRDFDLGHIMQVIICPTARAEDGLALSTDCFFCFFFFFTILFSRFFLRHEKPIFERRATATSSCFVSGPPTCGTANHSKRKCFMCKSKRSVSGFCGWACSRTQCGCSIY